MLGTKHFLLILASVFLVHGSTSEADLVATCRQTSCAELPTLLNNLGGFYYSVGQYRAAQPVLEEAVAIGGDGSLRFAISLSNLGSVYRIEARFAEAAGLFDRAIKILETSYAYGAELPRILTRAAMVAEDLRDFAKGEALCQHALELLDADSPDAATTHSTLAAIFESEGRLAPAEEHLLIALKRSTGQSLASSLNKLGLIYRQQGRLPEAERSYTRALEILRTSAPTVELGAALNNLGNTLAAQGRYKEAAAMLREGLTEWTKLLGPDHPNVAAALSNLATLARSKRQYSEAEEFLRRAMEIDRRHFPPGHVRIGLDLNNAGALAAQRKHYAAAETLMRQSLSILDKALPPDHPETGRVLANLAEVLRMEKRPEESVTLYARGLTILNRAWGQEDPRLLTWLGPYAGLLRGQQNFADAAKVDMQAMKIRVRNAAW